MLTESLNSSRTLFKQHVLSPKSFGLTVSAAEIKRNVEAKRSRNLSLPPLNTYSVNESKA
jgi:hypothetical protein